MTTKEEAEPHKHDYFINRMWSFEAPDGEYMIAVEFYCEADKCPWEDSRMTVHGWELNTV